MSGHYLGVDVGTSATRVSIVGEDGAVVASAGYPTRRGEAGQVEQDPAAWSQALAAALGQAGAELRRTSPCRTSAGRSRYRKQAAAAGGPACCGEHAAVRG